jgi:hypothetical protein
LGKQRFHLLILLLRIDSRLEAADVEVLGRRGRCLIVAGEHDNPQAKVVKGADRFRRRGIAG